MDFNSIEIKVRSCKDLKSFNFFQNLLLYARVSIISDDCYRTHHHNQQQRTPTDQEGDGNPEWNHDIRFDLNGILLADCDHLFIQFELLHEGLVFGDKSIGEVRVPIKDLVQDSGDGDRFVSYQVQSGDGKSNGVLNFSYKLNGRTDVQPNFPICEIDGFSTFHNQQSPIDLNPPPQANFPAMHSPQQPYQAIYPPPVQEVNSFSSPYSSGTQYAPYQTPYYPPPPDMYYPPAYPVFEPQMPVQPSVHGEIYSHHHYPPAPTGLHGWSPNPYGYAGPELREPWPHPN